MDELNTTWSGIAANMQAQAKSQSDPGSTKDSNKKGGTSKKSEENEIEDADFEVVD